MSVRDATVSPPVALVQHDSCQLRSRGKVTVFLATCEISDVMEYMLLAKHGVCVWWPRVF